MLTYFFYIAMVFASALGIAFCFASYTCSLINPRLGTILLRPAHGVAILVGILLVILGIGYVFGYPQPLHDFYGSVAN